MLDCHSIGPLLFGRLPTPSTQASSFYNIDDASRNGHCWWTVRFLLRYFAGPLQQQQYYCSKEHYHDSDAQEDSHLVMHRRWLLRRPCSPMSRRGILPR